MHPTAMLSASNKQKEKYLTWHTLRNFAPKYLTNIHIILLLVALEGLLYDGMAISSIALLLVPTDITSLWSLHVKLVPMSSTSPIFMARPRSEERRVGKECRL